MFVYNGNAINSNCKAEAAPRAVWGGVITFVKKLTWYKALKRGRRALSHRPSPLPSHSAVVQRCTQKELDNIEIDIVFEKYYLIFQCLQQNLCT